MQKIFSLLTFALLSVALLSCGTTKKKNPQDELGDASGKQRNGGGTGGGTTPAPVDFETYCASLKGRRIANAMCVYEKQKVSVISPKEGFSGIFSQSLGTGRRGWVIQTSGDPSGATALYTSINGAVNPFLPIDLTVRRARLEVDAGLQVMATQAFTEATVKIYECVDMEHHQIMCNPF